MSSAIAVLMFAGCDGAETVNQVDSTNVQPPRVHAPKVLLIGIDGADLRWIDRMAGRGRLPNFNRLMESGVVGPLETVHYWSPIVWTSVATGVVPVRHGIHGFVANRKPDGSPYDPNLPEWNPAANPSPAIPPVQVLPSGRRRPATVATRTRPAFWNILSHYKKSVGVLAWWATYPAERVNGYMVSPYLVFNGRKTPRRVNVSVDWTNEDSAKAFPPDLGNELGAMMYKASDIDRMEYSSVLGRGAQTTHSPWVLARDRSYFESALRTLRTRPVDCVAVYFQGPDVASHDFTYYVYGKNINLRRKPKVSKRVVDAARSRVEAMYEVMDGILGGLLDEVGPETNVLVVSDHGWEYDGTSHWNLNPGVFIAAGPGFRRGERVENVSVLDITPIILSVMEVPLAHAFDGKVPDGVLIEELASSQVFVDDYPIPPVSLAAELPAEVPEEEKMMKLLRGLGYVE